MKLHIISDGTNEGTQLLDESDNRIENVSKVEWSLNAIDGAAVATVTMWQLAIDAVVDAKLIEAIKKSMDRETEKDVV